MKLTTLQTADGLSLAAAHHSATADTDRRGTALLVHGLTQDMDEGGMYVRLADDLTNAGFDVVRFTFRGHGDSDGTPRGVTVAGERLDLQAALDHVRDRYPRPHVVVAKSFGAVSTCLSLAEYESTLAALVLWNPAIDLEATFLDPVTPWGRRHFTGDALARLEDDGSVVVREGFRVSRVLYEELGRYDPVERLADSDLPTLVVHGDADDIVPFPATRAAAERAGVDFHAIPDADHGFFAPGDDGDPDTERVHDRVTVDWLVDNV